MKNIIFLLNFIFVWICAWLSLSCDSNHSYEYAVFYDFDKTGMEAGQEYMFYPFESIDSVESKDIYDLNLVVRYLPDCSLSALPLKIEYGSLQSDSIVTFPLSLTLFEIKSRGKTKGNFGVLEADTIFLTKQHPEDGFFISVSTPESDTSNIISLGITSRKAI